MTILRIWFCFLIFSSPIVKCEDITVPIFYPKKIETKLELPEKLKPLVRFLQEDQANDFITSGDAGTLKWRLSKVTLITDELVSMSFEEGHIIVVGIFQFDILKKEWIIRAESGGSFKHRAFDSLTGKPK